MARRPHLRGAGRQAARHSAARGGPLGTLPQARGGLYVRRIRTGPHAQSRRAVQPRDQIRRLPQGSVQAGRRLRGYGPLLPQGRDDGTGRPHRLPPARGQRSRQGPELFPLPALAGTAPLRTLPRGRTAQARGAAHRRGAASGHCQAQGLAGHLLRREGRPPRLPPAETRRAHGQCARNSPLVAEIRRPAGHSSLGRRLARFAGRHEFRPPEGLSAGIPARHAGRSSDRSAARNSD